MNEMPGWDRRNNPWPLGKPEPKEPWIMRHFDGIMYVLLAFIIIVGLVLAYVVYHFLMKVW